MLNLAYEIDDTIIIDGDKYEVDMTFDNILKLIDMFADEEISDVAQVLIGIQMLLDTELENTPLDKQEQILFAVFNEMIGRDEDIGDGYDIEGNPMPAIKKESKRLYSFVQDADYIYASFMQDYRIDLIDVQGELHWYKFQALLAGLRKDTKFKEVVEIRSMELPTGKGTAKQRESIKDAQKAYQLKEDDI